MANEVEANATRAAFLSTPSIFFSLKNKELKANSVLFDLDPQWTNLDNYVIYDFNKPDELPEELAEDFDYVVIDPPFITHEVWALYAVATKKLLKPGGKILISTIPENTDFLRKVRTRRTPHRRETERERGMRSGCRSKTDTRALRARYTRGAQELSVEPRPFQPSIPNLVYQYILYSNYESKPLMELNPEIPQDD